MEMMFEKKGWYENIIKDVELNLCNNSWTKPEVISTGGAVFFSNLNIIFRNIVIEIQFVRRLWNYRIVRKFI